MNRLEFDGKRDPVRREMAEAGMISFVMPRGFETSGGGVPKAYRKTLLTYAVKIGVPFSVDTLEGTHTGEAGDYLAIGPAGEMYPIKRDIFEKQYEEDTGGK